MEPKNLKGVARQDKITYWDGNGNIIDLSKVIFPIIKQCVDGGYQLIGTGFFIADGGVFATAKHVLLDVFDKNGTQTHPIAMIHFYDDTTYTIRPILRCTSHDVADISVGIAAPMIHNTLGHPLKNMSLPLSSAMPESGETVCTYAYPRSVSKHGEVPELHLYADFFEGSVQESYPNGRDSVLMPGSCMQTSMYVHGGASGGPVFNTSCKVIGINSTGFDNDDLSFITPIMTIENLLLLDVHTPSNESGKIRVKELIEEGCISYERHS
jgi:hypothetical protein